MKEILHDYWGVITAMVSGFLSIGVWMSRINARTRENTIAIERLWKVRTEDRENLGKTLDDIKDLQREMQRDITAILIRNSSTHHKD